MAKIGSFSAAVREFDPDAERDTFDLFDQEFTVEGIVPPMLMLHLGAAMAGKAGQMEGNAAIWQALRCALTKPGRTGPDGKKIPEDDSQWRRFYQLTVAKGSDADDLIDIVFAIVGAQAGKAGERQSTSPPGPPQTSTNSNSSASDTPDSPGLRSVEDRIAGLA
jgi:hypothetical protein